MRRWLLDLPVLPYDFCWMAIEALFPAYLTPADLGEMLMRVTHPGEDIDHIAFSLKDEFKKITDLALATEVLQQMNQLLEQPPHIPRCVISQRNAWSVGAVRVLIRNILGHRNLNDYQAAEVGRGIWLVTQESVQAAGGYEFDDDGQAKPTLAEMTERHPAVRRQAFWLHFAQERAHNSEYTPSFAARWAWGHYLNFSKVTPADFEWVIADLSSEGDGFRRCGVLHLAISYWELRGRSRRVRYEILKSISDSSDLLSIFKQASAWSLKRRIKGWWERQKWEGIRSRYWWRRRWNILAQLRIRIRNYIWLMWHRNQLRRGELPNALYQLVHINGFDSRWAVTSWNRLALTHGHGVAKAVQEGCVAVWNKFDPRQSDSSDGRATLGLVAIDFLWRRGALNFNSCDDPIAEKATRYAIEELNGFSQWLPDLAKVRPHAVARVLRERVAASWDSQSSGANSIVDRLRWSKSQLGRLMAPSVLELLQQRNPRRSDLLHSAIHLLIQHSATPHSTYAELASLRLTGEPLQQTDQRLWLLILLQTDTNAALSYFDGMFSSGALGTDVTQCVVGICAELEDTMDTEKWLAHPRYLDPDVAPRFIRWVYRWVDEADDIHRSGSYSPVARDDAQRFRGRLLGSLASQETREAETALISLIDTNQIGPSGRDYALHLLERLSRRLADGQPWTCLSVREFDLHHRAVPVTLANVYGIACRRLRQIKTEIEAPFDVLMHPYVRPEDDENRLRNFLAMRLTQLSQGLYTIPQEAVVFAELRPDLRMERAGITGAIPIEVKLADDRSARSLLSDLDGQLIGDYLSSYQSRYGVFVVGLKDHRSHWLHPETGLHLDFVQLIDLLRQRAQELLAANSFAFGVEVVGIDFRPRSSVRE
jgi:hypothetical protein